VTPQDARLADKLVQFFWHFDEWKLNKRHIPYRSTIDTVVNYKSEDFLRDFTGTPASRLARRNGMTTPGLKLRLLGGRIRGQAIAVRRAAQERRSKLTWPVTPDNTASEKRSAGHPTKPATPPRSCLFHRNGRVEEFNEQPTRHVVFQLMPAIPRIFMRLTCSRSGICC
jgi:hypothetical protein